MYEWQKEKQFSEDQINNDRKVRGDVRDEMIRDECEKFMVLLEKIYPEQKEFDEKFMEQEFTRAGFQKPTSVLSFRKICEYLCSSPRSIWMQSKSNGHNIVIRRLSDEEIEDCYTKLLRESLLQFQDSKIQESEFKKLMFRNLHNPRIPPLNLHLKGLKLSFMDYIYKLLERNEDIHALFKERNLSFQGEPTV